MENLAAYRGNRVKPKAHTVHDDSALLLLALAEEEIKGSEASKHAIYFVSICYTATGIQLYRPYWKFIKVFEFPH